MKAYVVSDNRDTWLGMRLAGIEGVVVHEKKVFLEKMDELMKDETIGLVILTEKVMQLAPNEVLAWQLKTTLPLIVEIPDRHGTMYKESAMTRYIRESIGIGR